MGCCNPTNPTPFPVYSLSMFQDLLYKYSKKGGYTKEKDKLQKDLASVLMGAPSIPAGDELPEKGKEGDYFIYNGDLYIYHLNEWKTSNNELIWEDMEE